VREEGRVKVRLSGLTFVAVDLPREMAIPSNLAILSAVASGLQPNIPPCPLDLLLEPETLADRLLESGWLKTSVVRGSLECARRGVRMGTGWVVSV
jgi:hypothetical protein